MNTAELKINNLSANPFWDMDRAQLNVDKNYDIIIQRLLQYGLLNDWLLIYNYYGMYNTLSTVKQMKDMDNKLISIIL